MISLLLAFALTVTPTSPLHGQTVVFDGTFPAVAFRQAHNSQFHQNPYLSLNCGDQNIIALQTMTSFLKGSRNPDGTFNGQTYPILLDSPTWPHDATETCSAHSGYFTASKTDGVVWHEVASLFFTVS